MPVRWHECRRLQQLLGFERTPPKADPPFGWLESGERPHQLGLAVAFHASHADDLPARNIESYVLEAVAAQGTYREDDVARYLDRLRREARAERPSDHQLPQLRLRHRTDEAAGPDATRAQ